LNLNKTKDYFFFNEYLLRRGREDGIVKHGVLMKYEIEALCFLEKLQFHNRICCFDFFPTFIIGF
jgi:hypothetical protein